MDIDSEKEVLEATSEDEEVQEPESTERVDGDKKKKKKSKNSHKGQSCEGKIKHKKHRSSSEEQCPSVLDDDGREVNKKKKKRKHGHGEEKNSDNGELEKTEKVRTKKHCSHQDAAHQDHDLEEKKKDEKKKEKKRKDEKKKEEKKKDEKKSESKHNVVPTSESVDIVAPKKKSESKHNAAPTSESVDIVAPKKKSESKYIAAPTSESVKVVAPKKNSESKHNDAPTSESVEVVAPKKKSESKKPPYPAASLSPPSKGMLPPPSVSEHSDAEGNGADRACEKDTMAAGAASINEDAIHVPKAQKLGSRTSRKPVSSNGGGGVRQVPKKQDGFLTREAAQAMLSSCQLNASEFHDFVCARAFDVFSGGMYRKFLVQSRVAKETWAFNVQQSISKMQRMEKTIICVISSLGLAEQQAGSDSHLSQTSVHAAVSACVSSSSPPVTKRVDVIRQAMTRHDQLSSVIRCAATGIVLDDACIEVKAASRAPATVGGGSDLRRATVNCEQPSIPSSNPAAVFQLPVVVHPNFEHFFHMLWYCCKIEHVVRHTAKCWMEDFQHSSNFTAADISSSSSRGGSKLTDGFLASGGNNTSRNSSSDSCESDVGDLGGTLHEDSGGSSGSDTRVQEMCEQYSKDQEEVIQDMYAAFLYACEHVLESIYSHSSMVSFASASAVQSLQGGAMKESKTRASDVFEDGSSVHNKKKTRSKRMKDAKKTNTDAGSGDYDDAMCEETAVGGKKKDLLFAMIRGGKGGDDGEDEEDQEQLVADADVGDFAAGESAEFNTSDLEQEMKSELSSEGGDSDSEDV